MHILFIDESGTPPKPTVADPSYFVIGGIIIPEHNWHSIRDAMLGMKARRRIRGEIKWRYFAPGNTDNRNPMRHLDWPERDEIRSEIYQIICSHPDIRTMAAICSAPAAYAMQSISNQDDIYHLTYKTLSERFQYYLQDQSAPGRKELGIVVSDHRGPRDDKRLRGHHQKLLHSGAEFTSRYENMIEGLFLEQSNLSVGVQLADMVAGAIWRGFQKKDPRWAAMIDPSLRRNRNGQIPGYGIIKVPKIGWE